MRPLVDGTYIMPSFGRYEQSAELVRRVRRELAATSRRRPRPHDGGHGGDASRPSADRRRAAPDACASGRARMAHPASAAPASSWRPPPRCPGAGGRAARTRRWASTSSTALASSMASTQQDLEAELQALLEDSGIDIVVFTQEQQPVGTRGTAREDAARVLDDWQVGGETGRGAVMLWNINPQGRTARSGVALGRRLRCARRAGRGRRRQHRGPAGLANPTGRVRSWPVGMELEPRLGAAAAATAAPQSSPEPGATIAPRRPTGSDGRRPTSGLSPQRRAAIPRRHRGPARLRLRRGHQPRRSSTQLGGRPSRPSRSAPAPRSSSTRR